MHKKPISSANFAKTAKIAFDGIVTLWSREVVRNGCSLSYIYTAIFTNKNLILDLSSSLFWLFDIPGHFTCLKTMDY